MLVFGKVIEENVSEWSNINIEQKIKIKQQELDERKKMHDESWELFKKKLKGGTN